MSQRQVVLVECDNDGKTVALEREDDALPGNWRSILVTIAGGTPVTFDVCGLGCAERSIVKYLREQFGVPEAASRGDEPWIQVKDATDSTH